jgi:hypothetical protein
MAMGSDSTISHGKFLYFGNLKSPSEFEEIDVSSPISFNPEGDLSFQTSP